MNMIKKFYQIIKNEYGSEIECEGTLYKVHDDHISKKDSVCKISPDYLVSNGIIFFEILNELFSVKDFERFYVESTDYHLTGSNIVDGFGKMISITWLLNLAHRRGIYYESI